MVQIRNSVQVKLSLPREVDDWYGQYAALTGQSKAQAIAAFLTWKLPDIRYWVESYHRRPVVRVDSLPESSAAASPARQQDELDRQRNAETFNAKRENETRAQFKARQARERKLSMQGGSRDP